MKQLATFLLIILSIHSFSQIDYGLTGLIPEDSCNFEIQNPRLIIDTSNSNNDWVIGSTNKSYFGQAQSLPNAIMTDSLNSYSSNNLSYFDLGFNVNTDNWIFMNFYIQFDHKFETDTLIDGGFITVSYDSGQTWTNIINDSTCIACYGSWSWSGGPINSENLYTPNDTLMNGNFGFSGTSDWKTTTFQWIWMLPVLKDQTISDSLIVRFNFISDSLQTNKDGWIIDNIVMGDIYMGNSINELSNNLEVTLFPNLTDDYFNYQVKNNEPLETIVITNIKGGIVLSINNPLSENKIAISNLAPGNYFVKFTAKEKTTVKRLVVNK